MRITISSTFPRALSSSLFGYGSGSGCGRDRIGIGTFCVEFQWMRVPANCNSMDLLSMTVTVISSSFFFFVLSNRSRKTVWQLHFFLPDFNLNSSLS